MRGSTWAPRWADEYTCMCRPSSGVLPSTLAICSDRPWAHASARCWANSGVAPRAETLISTVSVGWDTEIRPISEPGVAPASSGYSASSMTCFAVLVLVAIARYDVTLDFASASPIEELLIWTFGSAFGSGATRAVTYPVAVAW